MERIVLIRKSYWVVLLGLLFSCHSLFSQNRITFGYDKAGNRVSRVISMLKSDAAEEMEAPTAIYSEVLEELEIKIYPNPTDGILFIELLNLPDNVLADMALYGLSGSLLDRKRDVNFSTEFNITNQPAGIYILRIIAGDKQTEWKIIKK
jgi:hypothetical protein